MKTAETISEIKTILGEGSLWDARAGLLLWLDIMDGKVFRFDPKSRANQVIPVPNFPSTIVPREKGGAVLTQKNGFAVLDWVSDSLQNLAEVEAEIETNRFNDGKCDPAGRFWAGTMDFDLSPQKGALYVLDLDLSVKKVLSEVTCSNGIVWSPDHKAMYYVDSPTQEVHAFDYDIDTAEISNRRAVIRIPKEQGIPDGITIDREGMLWVALFGGSAVGRYDPKRGKLIEKVEVPGARCVTSCALGGPQLKDLYITTSIPFYEFEKDPPEMHANGGKLFITPVEVQGLPAQSFKG